MRKRRISFASGIVLAAVVICPGLVAIWNQRKRRLLSDAQCAALLAMSLAVLGASVLFCWTAIPGAELEWIANRWELLSEAASLAMPGGFYAILVLSSRQLRRHGGAECLVLLFGTMVARYSCTGSPPAAHPSPGRCACRIGWHSRS